MLQFRDGLENSCTERPLIRIFEAESDRALNLVEIPRFVGHYMLQFRDRPEGCRKTERPDPDFVAGRWKGIQICSLSLIYFDARKETEMKKLDNMSQ